MSETHDKFESGCDFELDGPDKMSDLPIEDRLSAWMAWATYLKQRIKDHYRPRIAALEQELAIANLELLEKRIELLEKTLRILAATSDSEHAEEEK
jgi:outer membrane lipopolysaccharide assembly protein LptE/RlpB